MPLLGDSSGCQAGNPTCYESKLRADNAISTIKPQLIDPQHGDFRPVTGGNVFRAITYTIPAFAGGDRPNPPLAPQGELRNIVSCDFNGILRNIPGVPGALSGYINRPPNVPALPAGPASGYLKTSYSYTSSSTDPDGNQIRYGFDWGDGKSSASGLINSGTAASVSHSWDRAGTYNVRVNATDSRGGKSAYSAPKSVVISAANRPPAAPAAPLGPGTGVARAFYSYSGLATDPDGDNVKYTFDWGDGKTSQTGLVRSGQRTALSHSWASPGRYSIKVRATDSKKASSVWSGARVVSISSGSHLQSPSHRQSPKMQIVIPAQGQYFEL
jgi:hypothetical protein